jgi:hypothetical protein
MGMQEINDQLNEFSAFINDKLANFKDLTLGEQISYPVILVGFILILVAVVMMII